MPTLSLLALAQTSGGFSLERMVSNIPTDPASVFVYLLLLAAGWAIWKGSRPSRKGTGA